LALSRLPYIETVSIARLPTPEARSAAFRLQSGFIRADAREILAALQTEVGDVEISLLEQNRFELRFRLE
jgi:hypothetical protein